MSEKVSIIMAVHNAEKYLPATLQSILDQSFNEYEFIIINDASTDNSRDIVSEIKDERIKLYDNKEKLGLTKSLNLAIQKSIGKYIARMDGDDVSLPDRLKKQVVFLDANPEISLLGTSFYEINGNDEILGEVYMPDKDETIRGKIFMFNPFFHSSVMIPKNVLQEVGGYNEEFIYAQDYELWFRILGRYKGANLSELLMKRRKHKATLTRQKLRLQYYFSYKACLTGKELLNPSLADKFWVFKHGVISKMPSLLTLSFDKVRSHNLQYLADRYYLRDFR